MKQIFCAAVLLVALGLGHLQFEVSKFVVLYHYAMAYWACVHLPARQPEQAPEHRMPYRRSLHVSYTTEAGFQDIKES
jgi:hypothetical protein